jgi:hypothetical protein
LQGYEQVTKHQPEAAKAVHCPVEGVHVIGKEGTGDAENQLTQIGLTEYIAQTFLRTGDFV